jgi:hypothetical protein
VRHNAVAEESVDAVPGAVEKLVGITKSSGLCSSFSDPTAETETMRSTPSCLKP